MLVRRFLYYCGLLVLLSLGAVNLVSAQIDTLTYGTSKIAALDAAAPLALYAFVGTQGDLVSVQVTTVSGDITPSVSLLASNQQPIAIGDSSISDPYSRFMWLSHRLENSGTYSILMSSAEGGTGELLVRLDGWPLPTDALIIAPNETVNLPASVGEYTLTFDALAARTPLTLQADPVNLRYSAWLYDADGTLSAAVINTYDDNTFNAEAGEAVSQLIVHILDASDTGAVAVSLGTAASSGGAPVVTATSSGPPPPVSTEEVSPPGDQCTASSAGPVNIRSGDSTSASVLGSLDPGQFRTVIGINAARSWYAIDYNGQTGWVFADVVTISGPCDNLPIVEGGGPVNPTLALTATASSTLDPNVTPTATTIPPTATATVEGATAPPPTATYTATTAQEAPPDTDTFIFNVDRDNGGVFSEVISYSGGDTSDRIEVRVNLAQTGTDAARNVNITLTCSGTGTENVRFTRTSPNAQQYVCGNTISYRYAFPDSTQTYYVFIPSGSPSYVNYTLTATTSE